jgi:DNA-binding NarL/FixJ family response regulator
MCVDDHAVFLDGIALIVNLQADMRVVATATTGEKAVELYRQFQPDVTLMDLQMRTMDGVDTIKAIRREFPCAHIVVLTMYDGDQDVYRALSAGAAAYLLKDAPSTDVVRVIREVHAGRMAEPSQMARPAFTDRERQVLQLLAEGRRNKEIADALGVSDETIRAHLRHIYEKLHVNDRTHALTVAIRRGIVHVR